MTDDCFVCRVASGAGAGSAPLRAATLIVCPACGDTRCARAFNHAESCTGPLLPVRARRVEAREVAAG